MHVLVVNVLILPVIMLLLAKMQVTEIRWKPSKVTGSWQVAREGIVNYQGLSKAYIVLRQKFFNVDS